MYKKIITSLVLALSAVLLLAACSQPAQRLYATTVQYSGEDESTEQYLQIAARSERLFQLLEENAGAFVLEAYNYQALDEDGTPLYTANALSYPQEIDPAGYRITVSKNYFNINPVAAADGADLSAQIIYDDRTLNILVPEKLRTQEPQILEAYRAWFYFEKVTAENDYNEMAGRSQRLGLKEDDLQIHIIYVKDGQTYDLLRPDCAVEAGGKITDPIVEVYTGNIHCNYAHSFISQWTYLPSEAASEDEAFRAIAPYVEQSGANVQRVKAVEA